MGRNNYASPCTSDVSLEMGICFENKKGGAQVDEERAQ